MANNATTVWRWQGGDEAGNGWSVNETTPGHGNWLNGAGVPVSDYPTGSLATHTVKFLGADLLNATSRCDTGPAAPVTLLKIEADTAYATTDGPSVCFANCTVGTVETMADYDDPGHDNEAWVGIVAGAVTTAKCHGGTRITGGTIGTLKMYDWAILYGATITSGIVLASGHPYIGVGTGNAVIFSNDATIDVRTVECNISQEAGATGISFGGLSTDEVTMRFQRREGKIDLSGLTIITGHLIIDASRAYGFGGGGLFPL
ncbi:MAG: hypothetical protein IMZ57_04070 [Acidobacteria bacterium]|nr:hypothetical protein [Acidobacteriota bacterium]